MPAHPTRKQNRHRSPGTFRAPVAFVGTDDAQHALDVNPNRAKRHAAKLDNHPRMTPRQYSPGTPDGQRHFMPALETRWRGTPSLPAILTKRVPTRGDA